MNRLNFDKNKLLFNKVIVFKQINMITNEVRLMNIAYVRVSTVEHNEDRQIVALQHHKIDKWFTEKVSAKDTDRPQL